MKLHEFYAKYANIPLPKRSESNHSSGITPDRLYEQIKKAEEIIADQNLHIENMLVVAEVIIPNL